MAADGSTSELTELGKWYTSGDTFALPRTRRLLRGWDRAPVSAHAPRLQGQKVWKKVEIKTSDTNGNENEVQEELAREGAGARKKSRRMGAKESIANPRWKEKSSEASRAGTPSRSKANGVLTPSRQKANLDVSQRANDNIASPSVPVAGDSTSKAIPRKRTNTNHVITPKRVPQQTTLNRQAQQQPLGGAPTCSPAKTPRPRKSLRKSSQRGIIGRVSAEPSLTPRLTKHKDISPTPIKVIESLEELSPEEPGVRNVQRGAGALMIFKSPGPSTPISRPGLGKLQGWKTAPPKSMAVVEESSPNKSNGRSMPTSSKATKFGTSLGPKTPLYVKALRRIPGLDELLGTPEPDPPTMMIQDSSPEVDSEAIDYDDKVAESDVAVFTISSEEPSNEAFRDVDMHDDQESQNQDEPESEITSPDLFIEQNRDSPSDPPSPHDGETAKMTDDVSFSTDPSSPSSQLAEMLAQSAQKSESTPVVSAESSDSQERYQDLGQALIAEAKLVANALAETGSEGLNDSKEAEETVSAEQAISDSADNVQSILPVPSDGHKDDDDTAMLQNFLTRAKARKAAKKLPKRKRSLPHSPLRIPLGDVDNGMTPSPVQRKDELELLDASPSKRSKETRSDQQQDGPDEPQSIRRSKRTRLPVQGKAPPGAPSFIPVRRLGQEPDNTVTLKRSEEKELAALTRVNTRKNKAGALSRDTALSKISEEREDPMLRQRLLKELFEERNAKDKKEKKGKGLHVTWAEELARFQTISKGKLVQVADAKETVKKEKGKEKERERDMGAGPAIVEKQTAEKKTAVKVGVRSKMALGMAVNGTPAPKRRVRGRI
ncbi:MAG: hypothetical protein M1818_008056 [Claussenomyces sp. TS43310]|nr:MAG: hypothetical protein M1818_008056 [Claussenomyces sp. TS43310]